MDVRSYAAVMLNRTYTSVAESDYTIFSINLSLFANCRSQFLLDRLGRCLKLFISTDGTSSHEFARQFGLAFLYRLKNPKRLSRRPTLAQVSVDSPAAKGDNCGCGDKNTKVSTLVVLYIYID